MIGEPLRQAIVIANPQGLHMRPIVDFVELASRYQCEVTLAKANEPAVDGKSAFALLGLAAEQGTELILEVRGPDAPQALTALADVLRRVGTDDT